MIVAVKDALQRQQYLRAVAGQDYFRATLGMRFALYDKHPAAGWAFYTGARGCCAALAVHGDTAFACGEWDCEEVGVFLRFLGVTRLLTPGDALLTSKSKVPCRQSRAMTAAVGDGLPSGYTPAKPLAAFFLPGGQALPLPAKPRGIVQNAQPPMGAVAGLLWPAGSQRDAFYAEGCAARNHGWAEYRLAMAGEIPAATVGACAIYGGEAYMAAGQTAPGYRGQGIGAWLIVTLANALAARGQRVTLLCEASLEPFYTKLGFWAGNPVQTWNAEKNEAATKPNNVT